MTIEEIKDIVNKVKCEKIDELSLVNFDGEIPDDIFYFDWLEKLYLYGCPKINIESCFKLKNLKLLHLRFCDLSSFKGSSSLIKLEELNLEGNNLKTVPNDLPKSIISLDLSENQLISINQIETLPNLFELFLMYNKIQEVPDFTNNQNLELIELGGNNISKFPRLLVKNNYNRMKEHKFDVHIYDNPFIENMNLDSDKYILKAEYGYVNGLSNSELLLEDFKLIQ